MKRKTIIVIVIVIIVLLIVFGVGAVVYSKTSSGGDSSGSSAPDNRQEDYITGGSTFPAAPPVSVPPRTCYKQLCNDWMKANFISNRGFFTRDQQLCGGCPLRQHDIYGPVHFVQVTMGNQQPCSGQECIDMVMIP